MAAINAIPAMRCRADGIVETVILESAVVKHVCKHRQLSWSAREAGGQLFGTVADNHVVVHVATGPYCRDVRGRFHYRSHAPSAQRAIRRQARSGLVYLGEWHSHAENVPRPSGADEDAMKVLKDKSELRVQSLILLIVGRGPPPAGFYLCSTDGGTLQRWTVSAIEAST